MPKPYYRHHPFFRVRQRDDNNPPWRQNFDARSMCIYTKKRAKEMGIAEPS